MLTVLTGVFEMRVYEYRDEMEEMQVPVAHNVKSVGKKMINFIVESGTLSPSQALVGNHGRFLFAHLLILVYKVILFGQLCSNHPGKSLTYCVVVHLQC